MGWEPPELATKIASNQRISMYISVKTDIFQLGMTLWAIAMQEDEPERQEHLLILDEDTKVPQYYRKLVTICLSPIPQQRLSAKELLTFFPPELWGSPPFSVLHSVPVPTSDIPMRMVGNDPQFRPMANKLPHPYYLTPGPPILLNPHTEPPESLDYSSSVRDSFDDDCGTASSRNLNFDPLHMHPVVNGIDNDSLRDNSVNGESVSMIQPTDLASAAATPTTTSKHLIDDGDLDRDFDRLEDINTEDLVRNYDENDVDVALAADSIMDESTATIPTDTLNESITHRQTTASPTSSLREPLAESNSLPSTSAFDLLLNSSLPMNPALD